MPKGIGYVGRVYICFRQCMHGPFGLARLDTYELLQALLVSNSVRS